MEVLPEFVPLGSERSRIIDRWKNAQYKILCIFLQFFLQNTIYGLWKMRGSSAVGKFSTPGGQTGACPEQIYMLYNKEEL